jgi:hypothetical protein
MQIIPQMQLIVDCYPSPAIKFFSRQLQRLQRLLVLMQLEANGYNERFIATFHNKDHVCFDECSYQLFAEHWNDVV